MPRSFPKGWFLKTRTMPFSSTTMFDLAMETQLYEIRIQSWNEQREVLKMHHARFYADDRERRKWQNPERILTEIGLKRGSTFVDVGCGEGFFAIPAAKIVGNKGKVYALDADEQAIGKLQKKAKEEGLTNLLTHVGIAEEDVFCESCADVVFFGIVLHDFQAVSRVLENAKRMLKPGGMLVDLDWKKEPMQFGPPLSIRFDETQAADLLEKAGFRIEGTKESGIYHYVILARLR
jgi:ubiquinone/menaquinone biosynthesis C-methylase UbiE